MPRVRASDLVTWHHCRKKFEYKLARGWEVEDNSASSVIGTAFHAGLAEAYLSDSMTESAHLLATESLIRTPEYASQENFDLVSDMLDYYWANKSIDIAEVLETEPEMEMTMLCQLPTTNGPQMSPFTITLHPDLIARDSQGQLLLLDHKTKKVLPGAYEWFQLSTQMKIYAVACWRKYGEIPKVIHNLVRQQIPPGFGHRDFKRNKDGSPSKRQASTDVNDYLRSQAFIKSEDALAFYEQDLRNMCTEIILAITGIVRFERNEGILCERCPYLLACIREDAGETLTEGQARLLFKTKEEEDEDANETPDGSPE